MVAVLAGNLQVYTLLYLDIEGSLSFQEASVSLDRSTNSQPVNTVAGGYSGESPGAAMCELSCDNAVPAAGFEFNAGQNMQKLIPTEMGLAGPGGQRLRFKGFIISDTIKHAVNSESLYSFKVRGRFSDWE